MPIARYDSSVPPVSTIQLSSPHELLIFHLTFCRHRTCYLYPLRTRGCTCLYRRQKANPSGRRCDHYGNNINHQVSRTGYLYTCRLQMWTDWYIPFRKIHMRFTFTHVVVRVVLINNLAKSNDNNRSLRQFLPEILT